MYHLLKVVSLQSFPEHKLNVAEIQFHIFISFTFKSKFKIENLKKKQKKNFIWPFIID